MQSSSPCQGSQIPQRLDWRPRGDAIVFWGLPFGKLRCEVEQATARSTAGLRGIGPRRPSEAAGLEFLFCSASRSARRFWPRAHQSVVHEATRTARACWPLYRTRPAVPARGRSSVHHPCCAQHRLKTAHCPWLVSITCLPFVHPHALNPCAERNLVSHDFAHGPSRCTIP